MEDVMKTARILVAAVAASLFSGAAFAAEVSKQLDVAASPDASWAAVGAFCAIGDWHPAIETCELSNQGKDKIRTLTLKGGGTIVEKLVKWEPRKRSYTYAIVSSPLPVSEYVSTLSVKAQGQGSRLSWTGKFSPVGDEKKAKDTVAGIYTDGLAGIAKKAGS
jgi:hypothetical protein